MSYIQKQDHVDVSGSGWAIAIAKEWGERHGESLETKEEQKFKYPLVARAFSTEEVQAMVEVILSGQLTMSHNVIQFEKDFAEWVGAPYAVMVNSGSSANLLAMAVATNPVRGARMVPKGNIYYILLLHTKYYYYIHTIPITYILCTN